jgi:S1-C subfamily serine protease
LHYNEVVDDHKGVESTVATKKRQRIVTGGVLLILFILVAAVTVMGFLVARRLISEPRVVLPGGVDPATSGVLIVQLPADSPAAEAGLRRGAILFSVDGLLVRDRHDLNQLLEMRGPGAEVTLLVLQGDEPEEVTVTLGNAPSLLGAVLLGPTAPVLTSDGGGTGAAAATTGGAPPGDRPVVTRVIPNSPAERAGFRSGDVITAVGDRPVTTVDGFIAILQTLEPGQEVVFLVQRTGGSESLSVLLEERVGSPGEPFLGVQLPPADPTD